MVKYLQIGTDKRLLGNPFRLTGGGVNNVWNVCNPLVCALDHLITWWFPSSTLVLVGTHCSLVAVHMSVQQRAADCRPRALLLCRWRLQSLPEYRGARRGPKGSRGTDACYSSLSPWPLTGAGGCSLLFLRNIPRPSRSLHTFHTLFLSRLARFLPVQRRRTAPHHFEFFSTPWHSCAGTNPHINAFQSTRHLP